MMSLEWIAEEDVVFVQPDGRRIVGRVALGRPVRVDPSEARCPVALDGYMAVRDIIGSSTLQALLLAMRFIGTLLRDFISAGGRVLDPEDGTDFPLDSFFGSFLATS